MMETLSVQPFHCPLRTATFRLRRSASVLIVVALGVAGCVSRGNVDLLEAQLRESERTQETLQSHLDRTDSELEMARKEADALRKQIADDGRAPLLPEQADVLFRTTGIKFQSLLTGGLDRDALPGDDALAIMLAPHDGDGESVKLPGKIELELMDLTRPADQQEIASWSFSAEESRQHWHSGFLGAGYRFHLPWQQTPEANELVLHGRLTAPDGRQFDTSCVVKITPPQQTLAQAADPADSSDASDPADALRSP